MTALLVCFLLTGKLSSIKPLNGFIHPCCVVQKEAVERRFPLQLRRTAIKSCRIKKLKLCGYLTKISVPT